MQKDKESDYQEGIDFIKQGKWEEASQKFVTLSDEPAADSSPGYKYAHALYKYASAKELFEQGYIAQAYSDIGVIPYGYHGPFEKDIYFFQKEVAEKYNALTPEQLEQESQQYEAMLLEKSEQMMDEYKEGKGN